MYKQTQWDGTYNKTCTKSEYLQWYVALKFQEIYFNSFMEAVKDE